MRPYWFGLLWVLSIPAQAWTVVSPNLVGWQVDTLTFYVNPDDCQISEATLNSVVDQALAVWNSVPSSNLKLVRGAKSSQTVASFLAGTATQVPLIICDPAFSSNNAVDPDGVPAGTRFGTSIPLNYAGIMMNGEVGTGAEISNFSEAQLVIILAHEIGHVLGLGHSGSTDALMYYSISGKTSALLAQDDRDGITYLYPRNEFARGTFGCGIRSSRQTKGEMWGVWMTWLLGALGVAIARTPGAVRFFRKRSDCS